MLSAVNRQQFSMLTIFICRQLSKIDIQFSVAIAKRSHPFPFRSRQLSSSAPMVLPGRPGGRVGRRRILFYKIPHPEMDGGFFYCPLVYSQNLFICSFCLPKTNQKGSRSRGPPEAGLPCAARKERTPWKVAYTPPSLFIRSLFCCSAA